VIVGAREPGLPRAVRTAVLFLAAVTAVLVPVRAFAATPLEACYEKAGSQGRPAVAACLDAKLKDAEARMAGALAARQAEARSLAKATGRDASVRSLAASQRRFLAYRDAQCRYLMDALDAGTGAGDTWRDCLVRLADQRADELKSFP
jgi:uncharacterized protein YecT (DUF1311 family)